MRDELRHGLVVDLLEEVGFPVPLQSAHIERIEHPLQGRMWNWPHPIERRRSESGTDWRENRFRLIEWAGVTPDDSAHGRAMQFLREWRTRRHGKEGEKAIEIIGL